jgi:hypothetical protein
MISCLWFLFLTPASHADQGASFPMAPAVQQAVAEEGTKPLLPATVSFSSQTTLRAFESDTTEGEQTAVLPIYE